MEDNMGASQANGLGSAEAPEPHSGLGPTGAIPSAEWRKGRGRYSWGEEFWLGRICVGSATNDSGKGRDDPLRWRATIDLPSVRIPQERVYHETMEEARDAVERAVRGWMRMAGLACDSDTRPKDGDVKQAPLASSAGL